LADERSEWEAMQVRRQRVSPAAQQAAASASRASNFLGLHRSDLDRPALQALQNAQAQLQSAQQLAAGAERGGTEDAALGGALEQAAAAYAAAQQSADAAYNHAAQRFGQMENLRRQTHEAITRAESVIQQATAFIQEHQGEVSDRSVALLRQADEAMPEWRDGADEATLRAMAAGASRAEELAREAYQGARDEVDRRERQMRDRQTQDAMGQLIMGAAIGSLL